VHRRSAGRSGQAHFHFYLFFVLKFSVHMGPTMSKLSKVVVASISHSDLITRDRCYDQNFKLYFPMFGEKCYD
jgi:hypothetical protein